jgi:hypothetical protein
MPSISSLAVAVTATTAGLSAGLDKSKSLVGNFVPGVSAFKGQLAAIGGAIAGFSLVNTFTEMVKAEADPRRPAFPEH